MAEQIGPDGLEPFRVTEYREGSRWFLRDAHYYVASRNRGGAYIVLRCSESSSLGCRAEWRQRLGAGRALAPINGFHNHDSLPWIGQRNEMYQYLRAQSEGADTDLQTIYTDAVRRYPEASPHLLFEHVISSMRNWRRARVPPVPVSLEAYGEALAQHPLYSHRLLGVVHVGNAWAVIMVMEDFAECLRQSTTLFADGTFQCRPAAPESAQLLTLTCVYQGHFFHPVVALMANRTRPLYEAVLRRVWEAAGHPEPTHVLADFEEALHGALQAVTGTRTKGCFFHLAQALRRRARDLGLPVYRVEQRGSRLARLYATLALLPPDRIPMGLAEIPDLAGEDYSQPFHDYFVAQWIVRVGAQRFSVTDCPHRTTNASESYHASLLRTVGVHPNIWRFTNRIDKKFGVCQSRFLAQRRGERLRMNVRQFVVERYLLQQERALEVGRITLRDFILTLSRNVRMEAELPEEEVPEVALEVEVGDDLANLPEVQLEPILAPILPQAVQPPVPVGPAIQRAAAPHARREARRQLRAVRPQVVRAQVLAEPALALQQDMIVPAAAPQHDYATPATVPQQDFGAPAAAPQQILDAPAEVPQQDLGGPAAVPREDFAAPAAVPQQDLAAPVAAPQQDFGAPAAVCRICMANLPSLAMIPCGHICCRECLNSSRQANPDRLICFYCRMDIIDTLNIYFG